MKASSLCFPIALTASFIRAETTTRPARARYRPRMRGFRVKIERTFRGGHVDIKIASGLFRGLSALHNTTTAGPLIEKDRATTKPNARRMANDSEGASEMMGTLARDGSCEKRRAEKLE